jgi:N-acetylmuramic acid 6-phosphate etherase
MTKPDLDSLATEARHPHLHDLDTLPTPALLAVMNDLDAAIAAVVRTQLPQIAAAVDCIAEHLRKGGRLLYVGAGSSGRLGVLDAAECGPTFSSPPGQVVGVMAGGPLALQQAVEGVEDDAAAGGAALRELAVGSKDVVCGLSASGRTPYVLGALEQARAAGAATLAVVASPGSPAAALAQIAIEVVTGPEILTGSTRLAAGTATKMVCNMLSTGAFVRLHKTYGNLMVDLQASNQKLRARAERIVALATGCDLPQAAQRLQECGGEVKTAILVQWRQVSPATARTLLFHTAGSVRAALAADLP